MSSQKQYTPEQRRKFALDAMSVGPAIIAEKTGVAKSTVQGWMRDVGVPRQNLASRLATSRIGHSSETQDASASATAVLAADVSNGQADADVYSDQLLNEHSNYTSDAVWENWEYTLQDQPDMNAKLQKCVRLWGLVKLNGVQEDYDSYSRKEYDTHLQQLADDIYELAYVSAPDTPEDFERAEWERWVAEEGTEKVKNMLHTAVLDMPSPDDIDFQ